MQIQKALRSLASHQGPELGAIISGLDKGEDQPYVAISEAKDITASFLAPPENSVRQEFPESKIKVYKGLLRRLAGKNPNNEQVAILAGSEMSITSVILSDDLEQALASTDVLNHWKTIGCEPMGLAVFKPVSDPSEYGDMLQQISAVQNSMLLMAFTGAATPSAWIADRDDSTSTQFLWSPVRVGNHTAKRKQHSKISFVHATRIGVSFDDEVGFC